MQLARGRSAFFMVDYKNAERLRQLFASLSADDLKYAAERLRSELEEESKLRVAQGFDQSLEPTLEWNSRTEGFVEEVRKGNVHPAMFTNAESHPSDPYFPAPNKFQMEFFLYDLWCQVMARAIITVRRVYDLSQLLSLEDPGAAGLVGSLLSFEGTLKGQVYAPATWTTNPIGTTTLTVSSDHACWQSNLNLKTHYVYSDTGAMSLSSGKKNGILVLQSIDSVENSESGERVVRFSCTPLIIGSGVLQVGQMNADA